MNSLINSSCDLSQPSDVWTAVHWALLTSDIILWGFLLNQAVLMTFGRDTCFKEYYN